MNEAAERQTHPPELIKHLENYFHILDCPEVDHTQSETEVIAGQYFNEQIRGKYEDSQINSVLYMLGK